MIPESTASLLVPEVEVSSKAKRRVFTLEFKRRILGEADACTKPGEVGALLRREGPTKTTTLSYADITLDTRTHDVRRGEREISLTSKEYLLLELLMRNPGQVLSRGMIAEHMWNIDTDNLSNVIDVYIRYLRRKLCEDGEPDLIHTIRGFGYQLKEP